MESDEIEKRLKALDELADCFTDDIRISIGISGERQGKTAIARLFKEEIGTRTSVKSTCRRFTRSLRSRGIRPAACPSIVYVNRRRVPCTLSDWKR